LANEVDKFRNLASEAFACAWAIPRAAVGTSRVERRLQAPPQRGPREERAVEGRVDAGVESEPEDEEDGHDDDVARAVRRRPHELHECVDEEAHAVDAHHVGDGQYTRRQQSMATARWMDRLASGRASDGS